MLEVFDICDNDDKRTVGEGYDDANLKKWDGARDGEPEMDPIRRLAGGLASQPAADFT